MDIGTYANTVNEEAVGADGEHLELRAAGVNWGSSADSKATAYFFTRTASGWRMVSATPQPEAGEDTYDAKIFNADLTETGLEVDYHPTPVTFSEDVELKTGPPGGPYATVVSIPHNGGVEGGAWAAAAANGSKMIIRTDDYALPGHQTETTSGSDLYEWSGGSLRQLNVLSNGAKISACGARMADGSERYGQELDDTPESAVLTLSQPMAHASSSKIIARTIFTCASMAKRPWISVNMCFARPMRKVQNCFWRRA